MPHYHIWTIGCQMNRAESERLGACFEKLGYLPVDSAEEADLVVLNSCVVRKHAEDKVINKISILKNLKKIKPEVKIAVTGCLVDSQIGRLKNKFPHVDYFFKAGGNPQWLGENVRPGLPRKPLVSAFVTIIQGCNNFCTYCIVPYRRGREVSLPLGEVVCEVKELVRRGAKEIVLLGQNVDSYGHDLPGEPELADLIDKLNDIEGLLRIRFLTNHPKDMSSRLIDTIAGCDKVCEQLNLPIQSGDDDILKAMGREYTVEHYRNLVTELRKKVPGIALSTDVIIGFPGESRKQFDNTIRLLSELRFDAVHAAVYSPRAETLAARKLKDDVPEEEKKERLHEVEKLQKAIAGEINAGLKGEIVEVLITEKKGDKWQGRSRSDKLVFLKSNRNLPGKLVDVRIEKTSPWSLQGKLEKVKNNCGG